VATLTVTVCNTWKRKHRRSCYKRFIQHL